MWRNLPASVRRSVLSGGNLYRNEAIGKQAGAIYDQMRQQNTPEAHRAAATWRATIESMVVTA